MARPGEKVTCYGGDGDFGSLGYSIYEDGDEK